MSRRFTSFQVLSHRLTLCHVTSPQVSSPHLAPNYATFCNLTPPSSFGPTIVSMDSEAVNWARRAAQISSNSPPPSGGLLEVRAKHVNINLSSTRHLIITLQGMLLAVPVKNRRSAENTTTISTIASNSIGYAGDAEDERSSTWFERKRKCDALLSLCASFTTTLDL
jgi:hypothetical protein